MRRLLADDPDQVIWLHPDEAGSFRPESVPDGAFRSLEDWVDYVIEADQTPLAAWIGATRFDFDHFVCRETGGPKNKPDKADKDKPREDGGDGRPVRSLIPAPKGPSRSKSTGPAPEQNEFLVPPEEAKPPSEWLKRRVELEERFKLVDGRLDAPERVALWPELAIANAGSGEDSKRTEAAICWLNAMWAADPVPAEWFAAWARAERPGVKAAVRADEFDAMLANTSTAQEDARATIASFLWLAAQNPIPHWLPARFPAVQAFLEKNESILPVRAVWLLGYRLSQLSGRDVLGLARIRDRLLQRLLEQGLTAERDLPKFLQYEGKDSERLRMVNEKAMEVHSVIRKWTEHIPQNLPYVDLLFAFVLGKLGETSRARKLLDDARKVLEVPVPAGHDPQDNQKVTAAIVSNFLFKAFRHRVEQVLLARPHAGQFPEDLQRELDGIQKTGANGGANHPYKLAHYVISRMREQSAVLEPVEKLDPYSEWTKSSDVLKKELADLHAMQNPLKLADQVRKLYKNGVSGRTLKEVQFFVLHEALPLSPRIGESFTVELLNLVPGVLDGGPTSGTPESNDVHKKQGELLERALFLSGHFDRVDLAKKLVDEFGVLLSKKPEESRYKLINAVAAQCLTSLKKLGMRDEIDRFLNRLRTEVLGGATMAELKRKHASKPESWAAVLQTLLRIAAGWLAYAMQEQATPILNEARNELLNPHGVKLGPKDYTELARSYVAACGQCQTDMALSRIVELFKTMDKTKITNTFTTAASYSRFHLNLVEEVALALVKDDSAISPSGRKWLDEDEYLVRRRIHADMRRERQKSGL